MKVFRYKVPGQIKRSPRFMAFLALMALVSILMGCSSQWALSPRDRSIKKWESYEQGKLGKSPDSTETVIHSQRVDRT